MGAPQRIFRHHGHPSLKGTTQQKIGRLCSYRTEPSRGVGRGPFGPIDRAQQVWIQIGLDGAFQGERPGRRLFNHDRGLRREEDPKLLACRYDGSPCFPALYRDITAAPERLNVVDAAGANLWWAVAQSRSQDPLTHQNVLGRLARQNIYANPDRQGRGLFFRHPYWPQVLRQGYPGDAQAIVEHYQENPFWDSLQKHPEGFFGNTPEGQFETAMALWKSHHTLAPFLGQDGPLKPEAWQFISLFDGRTPEDYHPGVRLLLITLLAELHAYNGTGYDDLQTWAPDFQAQSLQPFLEQPSYLQVLSTSPALQSVAREQRLKANSTSCPPRRRMRS